MLSASLGFAPQAVTIRASGTKKRNFKKRERGTRITCPLELVLVILHNFGKLAAWREFNTNGKRAE
jgi:hypothetical protein